MKDLLITLLILILSGIVGFILGLKVLKTPKYRRYCITALFLVQLVFINVLPITDKIPKDIVYGLILGLLIVPEDLKNTIVKAKNLFAKKEKTPNKE